MNLANKITFSRLLLIPLFMVFATSVPYYIDKSFNLQFFGNYATYIAAGIFILVAGTDKLDGYIARKLNQVTKLGIFLDPLVDKLLIIGALIVLVQKNDVAGWIALIIISREIIVTGFRMVAVQKQVVLAADRFGKYKMVAQVVAVGLTLLDNYPISLITSIQIDDISMIIAVILTVFSGANYIVKNKRVFI